jgi:adenylate cyclase class 2
LSVETEIKIKIGEVEDFCSRLGVFHPQVLSERHFEDNYLLDFPDRKLKSSRYLLRIRFAREDCYLTFKGAPRPDSIFKSREELETKLGDGRMVLRILERIGMEVCFQYQKYRREFALGQVHIAVDETPIGNYAEFEGEGNEIRALAAKMGIAESHFIRLSYYSLYLEYCQGRAEVPSQMVY